MDDLIEYCLDNSGLFPSLSDTIGAWILSLDTNEIKSENNTPKFIESEKIKSPNNLLDAMNDWINSIDLIESPNNPNRKELLDFVDIILI